MECHRRDLEEEPQWAAKGVINDTSFGYRGLIQITQPAPLDAEVGNIYSVSDGGIADDSFIGLAGTQVDQWTLIIYAEPDWVRISAPNSPGFKPLVDRFNLLTVQMTSTWSAVATSSIPYLH